MRRIALIALVTGFLAPFVAVAPASAQATRTWVSGVGDDVNPCSRTAPCKTFAGAISKTATNGEINCIDPGGFGAVTLTKSITIDCTAIGASILASGTNGIIINATNAAGTDTLRTIRIRGISINGSGSNSRTGIRGISILAAAAVFVDDVLIDNFTQQGIGDVRTAGGALFVSNSTIRNNAVAGIGVAVSGGAYNVVIENTRLERNGIGLATANTPSISVKRSVISGNLTNGVQSEGGQTSIEGSDISSNSTGIQATSGTVRIANNDIMFNSPGSGINGATSSFGLNRIAGNATAGTAPTAAGAPSDGLGTQ
jgi:hypothetical protein